MARPRQTEHTEQNILNNSYDSDFDLLAVELMGYDPLTEALKRITTNALGEYNVNDLEEVGSIQYLGKEDSSGDWYIQKIDSTSGKSIRYATINNNTSITSYSDAWTNRATLTYDTYGTAF